METIILILDYVSCIIYLPRRWTKIYKFSILIYDEIMVDKISIFILQLLLCFFINCRKFIDSSCNIDLLRIRIIMIEHDCIFFALRQRSALTTMIISPTSC